MKKNESHYPSYLCQSKQPLPELSARAKFKAICGNGIGHAAGMGG